MGPLFKKSGGGLLLLLEFGIGLGTSIDPWSTVRGPPPSRGLDPVPWINRGTNPDLNYLTARNIDPPFLKRGPTTLG